MDPIVYGKSKRDEFIKRKFNKKISLVDEKKGLSEPKRLNLKTIVFNEQKSKNKNSMFSLGEAFSCSLDSMLRQSEKASFRNYFKNKSNSNTSKCPQGVSWFVDDLTLV